MYGHIWYFYDELSVNTWRLFDSSSMVSEEKDDFHWKYAENKQYNPISVKEIHSGTLVISLSGLPAFSNALCHGKRHLLTHTWGELGPYCVDLKIFQRIFLDICKECRQHHLAA